MSWERAYAAESRSRAAKDRTDVARNALDVAVLAVSDVSAMAAKIPGALTPGQAKSVARMLKRLSRMNADLSALVDNAGKLL